MIPSITNLFLAQEIHGRLRDEEEHDDEGRVVAGEHQAERLPLQQGAQQLAVEHAQGAGHGGHHGQPGPHLRRRDLHDVEGRQRRREPEAGAHDEPENEWANQTGNSELPKMAWLVDCGEGR